MTAREILLAIATNLRAAFKRFLAWLGGEPLIDVRLLPNDLKTALRPFLRPTVRYLSFAEAQRLIEAACALMASYERIYVHHIDIAKNEASLDIASAMAALAYQPAERIPTEFEHQLAGRAGR